MVRVEPCSPLVSTSDPVSWRRGLAAIVQQHTHTALPSVGDRHTLGPSGGFSAHYEVSVDLMAGRNLFIMN